MSRRTGVELVAMLVLLSLVSVALADPKEGPCVVIAAFAMSDTIECNNAVPNGCSGLVTYHWTQQECQKEKGSCEERGIPEFTIRFPKAEPGFACHNEELDVFWKCVEGAIQNNGNGTECD